MTQFLVGPLSRLAGSARCSPAPAASAERLAEALAAPPAVRGRRRGPASRRRAAALAVDGLRHGPLDGLALDVAAGACTASRSPTPRRRTRCSTASGARPSRPPARSPSAASPLTALDPGRRARRGRRRPHEPALLADTVAANVAAAAGGDAAAVARAIAAAAVEDVVAALPEGAATRLDRRRPLALGRAAAAGRARPRARRAGARARAARADHGARRRDRGPRRRRAARGARRPHDAARHHQPGAARGLRRGHGRPRRPRGRPRARTPSCSPRTPATARRCSMSARRRPPRALLPTADGARGAARRRRAAAAAAPARRRSPCSCSSPPPPPGCSGRCCSARSSTA